MSEALKNQDQLGIWSGGQIQEEKLIYNDLHKS